MERLKKWLRAGKRQMAGIMAFLLFISAAGIPIPVMGSEVWPQKSTAPYYCLDGGKGWKTTDRYDIYQYDTLPSPLTEIQAKRLFWAYPSNWNALKEAAANYDPELYQAIASANSGPNVVKRVKDDAGTKFAWVADHPEIEARAIHVLERAAAETAVTGNEVPEPIRDATSEETAASFFVPAMCEGPGALDTEFKLSRDFIRDIASIEPQSVWDNGSTGGAVGWLDASQDRNIAKAVMGEELYEVTWSGDSIKIHNNGSATANANVVGSTMSEEEMYNKTTVRYKITMRENAGWYTEGSWNSSYLTEWMDFKACINAPAHQRLYKADIRIVPSELVFYLVISQGPVSETAPRPEYGSSEPELSFQVYRHEETFEANYHVKLQKLDDETGMPLKGSQFYLYEQFEDEGALSSEETDGGVVRSRLSFSPWQGFQIFADGVTDENGEIRHTDTRSYQYEKTYCDGHGMPVWAKVESSAEGETEGQEGEEHESGSETGASGAADSGTEASGTAKTGTDGAEAARDQNRKAAKQWLALYESCEEAQEYSEGSHFHWQIDPDIYDLVQEVAETGEPGETKPVDGADAETAFEASGCRADCEKTYHTFINLRFTYTWKEIQARTGYILHDVHQDDRPIELITTDSSEAGANAAVKPGSSREITEQIWYSGNGGVYSSYGKIKTADSGIFALRRWAESAEDKIREWLNTWIGSRKPEEDTNDYSVSLLNPELLTSHLCLKSSNQNAVYSDTDAVCSDSDAVHTGSNVPASSSDASAVEQESSVFRRIAGMFSLGIQRTADDSEWEEPEEGGDFDSYFDSAEEDHIEHLRKGESENWSYAGGLSGQSGWIVRDHRTEGEIHINKRDMDLYCGEDGTYSAYGDTEGDNSLEGAVYGLFAAEDIVHPDSDILSDGTMTNTGIVYKKNDLVATAVTDVNGDADFYTCTEAPGRTYCYDTGQTGKRDDISWDGPQNRYEENQEKYGNRWIGRPLILGNYYVKELSRSEGFELSVNGNSKERSNYGAGTETPETLVEGGGTAIVAMPELSALMEGEDRTGNGYDRLTFTVTSAGTADKETGGGYELIVSGFPKGTGFYRVDSGEMEVTGPHVTGTETVIVTDEDGKIIWKTAESDTSDVKYEAEYDSLGNLTGQIPVSRIEPQIMKAEHVPQLQLMNLEDVEIETADTRWKEAVLHLELEDRESEAFGFLKAETEQILYRNGYDTPVNAAAQRSLQDRPVFSYGVIEGEKDEYGMTATAGQPALKTVYGAALQTVRIEDVTAETRLQDLLYAILFWYREHPQWNYGGIHDIQMEEDHCLITLYAGASFTGSRQFFTMTENGGELVPDCVYALLENPKTLRWEYQEYGAAGDYQYRIDRRYSLGSGSSKRYYLDVTLAPAVMIGADGVKYDMEHQVMVYHEIGEEIVDYLDGDPENGYKVPLTEVRDKIEITTESEYTETDVHLDQAEWDSLHGVYRIPIETNGRNSFGEEFSDAENSLTLTFMAKLPDTTRILTDDDIQRIGNANVYGYKAGEEIGLAEYLMRFTGASISVNTGGTGEHEDTYIVCKKLVYRGQHIVSEDGDSGILPVQVLERPIKQKIRVVKEVEGEDAVTNFRFKAYLLSNLERLYRTEDGTVVWQDRNGKEVDIEAYKEAYPELVQTIYTADTGQRILEKVKKTVIGADGDVTKVDTYNYEKFFDAIRVSNTDKWHNRGILRNTSWKPTVRNLFTGIENRINTSMEAGETAKRSDAVRQFAVDWYLEDEIEERTLEADSKGGLQAEAGAVNYADEIYDKALFAAVQKAEEYLKPFFLYDLDHVYEIMWDDETGGGTDADRSTLAADLIDSDRKQAFGISRYLPYGTYVIAEQQPYNKAWKDLENRHYSIDRPKELSLPQDYDETGALIPFTEVEWSLTEPEISSETEGHEADAVSGMAGYADLNVVNRRYHTGLRIEKLDAETGEPILHESPLFALFRAEYEKEKYGDGTVLRYEEETLISGSRRYLEAMGAEQITPFARGQIFASKLIPSAGAGVRYTGYVKAGTPICSEEDAIFFADMEMIWKQNTGYAKTGEAIPAGVYVLAELIPPPGYARSEPVPIEVFSDGVTYDPNGNGETVNAIIFGRILDQEACAGERETEMARILIHNTAVGLQISKVKTGDAYRGMKISGRVEGSMTELKERYGAEHLTLAYNSSGEYQGFGWKKGTLEYLQNRRDQGERVQLVYDRGVFQGYGYVTRTLETADDENRYVAGAEMALYKALEVQKTGDQEDFAYEDVTVERDRNGNVTGIRYGEQPLLFYDMGNLRVLETDETGAIFGYDRDGQRIRITFDTGSVYAIRDGQAVFEIESENVSCLEYLPHAKAFVNMDDTARIYHLDSDGRRDSLVDGYTGLAYVEAPEQEDKLNSSVYVWPVTEVTDDNGVVFMRAKTMTGRAGEKNSGQEDAYIAGSRNKKEADFEKPMNPIYDRYGMVTAYPAGADCYQKGEAVYDRDGEYAAYVYDDLLEQYNQAAYAIQDETELYSGEKLQHRLGEAWMIPNIWFSGEETPQDPTETTLTAGQPDLLRRVIPGTYILEELQPPFGYVKAMPVAVCVEETANVQSVSMTNEKTKVEISKIDAGTWTFVEGAELALFRAKRVYSGDTDRYPKGYYLEKSETEPAVWFTEHSETNEPEPVTGVWVTGRMPKYFEGIPAGDYILEERLTPRGYLASTMEITVKETEELQSFLLTDDFTKVEIRKYEKGENGSKQALSWPSAAELTLYPAILDSSGAPVRRDGEYLYDKEQEIASWKTGDPKLYGKIAEAYERMYESYGNTFEDFSWNCDYGDEIQTGHAVRMQHRSTDQNETTVQIWRLSDGSDLKILVREGDGNAGVDLNGCPLPAFEYLFRYEKGICERFPEMESYDLRNGLHRLDRIPTGIYVLAETEVPTGYHEASPVLILVEPMEQVQRFELENEKKEENVRGTLIIRKYDEEQPETGLSGAWFEVVNLQNGDTFRVVTGEDGMARLDHLPVTGTYESGESGSCFYEIKEILAPDGYQRETASWTVRFPEKTDMEAPVYMLEAANRKTEIEISKTDFQTGHFVEGARLSVYAASLKQGRFAADGEPVETWVSADAPHIIRGKLSCGKTYVLVEEEAPDGYQKAKPVRFTVSGDGTHLIHITEEMAGVEIRYEDDHVKEIRVTGRTAKEVCYEQQNQEETGLVRTEESLSFIDGSSSLLIAETFRPDSESLLMHRYRSRYPVYTEYVLQTDRGVRIDAWSSETDPEHEIPNRKSADGSYRFEPGESYTLAEYVYLSDGERILTGQMRILIGDSKETCSLELFNRETEVHIRKSDLTTGKELPGAKLSITDKKGTMIDEWISCEDDHVIRGILTPGETYVLREEMAAEGFAYAEEMEFTIRENGQIDRVIMEDRPTHVEFSKTDATTGEELPGAKLTLEEEDGTIIEQWISGTVPHIIRGRLTAGKTYRLVEELAPEGYLLAETVEFTVSLDGRIDKVEMKDQKKKTEQTPKEPKEPSVPTEGPFGYLTAAYEPDAVITGKIRRMDDEALRMRLLPMTGEREWIRFALIALLCSLGGIILLEIERRNRRDHREK